MTDFSTMTDAEVNRRVAEAMGYTVVESPDVPEWFDHIERFPAAVSWAGRVFLHESPDDYKGRGFSPATSIEDAWRLEAVARKHGWRVELQGPFDADDNAYHAGFTPHGMTGWNGRPDFAAASETPARAISEAFLAWHEAQKKQEV